MSRLQQSLTVLTLTDMQKDIFRFLADNAIQYERVDHPPVFTCEQAEELVPPMPGVHTKNLFVRDKKGRRHFLVVVRYSKSVDLKALSSRLGVSNLSLGSERRLQKYLGIEPGAVSLLAIINDVESAVEVVLDKDVWREDVLQCHPLVNTSTLAIRRGDVERIFEITGHKWKVLSIPELAR
jgi:Ala-tRNA(Pro) deacylase